MSNPRDKDETATPAPLDQLQKEVKQNQLEAKETASGTKLKAFKKPHNIHSYYGPPNIKKRLPVEDRPEVPINLPTPLENGYSAEAYRPPGSYVPQQDIPGPTKVLDYDQGAITHPGPYLSELAANDEDGLGERKVCEPHLQFLCGPLLRYDTVWHDHWKGAVMIVTNDKESIYDTIPTLTLEWEVDEKPYGKPLGTEAFDEEQPMLEGSKSGEPITSDRPEGTPAEATAVESFEAKYGKHTIDRHGNVKRKVEKKRTAINEKYQNDDDDDDEVSEYDDETTPPTSPTEGSSTWTRSLFQKFKKLDFRGGNSKSSIRLPPKILPRTRTARSDEDAANEEGNKRNIQGEAIYKFTGISGTSTFWRFMLSVPLPTNPPKPLIASYRINGGQPIKFHIAALNQNMRWAAYSCNGFSVGTDPNIFKGEGFESGFDPVWADLLEKHEQRPLHVLVGGGDQIYCDPLMNEPELQGYVALRTGKERLVYPVTDQIRFAIDRFYFNHYCLVFRNGCFARAISSIPMLNMLDDHDLIDGFGSYPDELQRSAFFSLIGNRGYFWFLLFQQFTVDLVDGTSRDFHSHTFKSTVIGEDGPWIPYPSHSSFSWMGPNARMCLLDCRAERKKDRVVAQETYDKIFELVNRMPDEVEHLIFQLGIPIAYPRMTFAEKLAHSDSVIATIAKKGFLPGGVANKYNKDLELLDDISDHWTAKDHKKERNDFIIRLQEVAQRKRVRISFISGDVHLGAVGLFKTWAAGIKRHGQSEGVNIVRSENGKGTRHEVEPRTDHRWMVNMISSGIVNTPPPLPAQAAINVLARKKHRTLHHAHTDEVMLPIFKTEPEDGSKKRKIIYCVGARNYLLGEVAEDENSDDVAASDSNLEGKKPSKGRHFIFDLRVEKGTGVGETRGYVVRVPGVGW